MFISTLRKKGLLLISTCGTFFFIEWAKKFLPAAGSSACYQAFDRSPPKKRTEALIIFVIPITSRIDPQHSLSRHPED